MANLFVSLVVDELLASIEIRRAEINANWNGLNPDIENPALWEKIEVSLGALGQDVQKLTFALAAARARI